MGCDIHLAIQLRENGVWDSGQEYDFDVDRNYALFGMLANVRNYADIPPIKEPVGVPDNFDLEWGAGHSFSFYSLEELLAFNWEGSCENRRVTRQTGPNSWNGGCTCDPGEGEKTTYREMAGPKWFELLEDLKTYGKPQDVRLVIGFDN